MKVPIRSKLTFCVSCSKSFKVHFKYKKYFTEDSWIQKKGIGRCLACLCAMKAPDQVFTGRTVEGKKKRVRDGRGAAPAHTHHRQRLLVVHVYLITPLLAFFALMVAVSQGEYNSPWVVMGFICIIQEMLCLCGLLLSCTIPRWAFFLDHNSRSISVYITRLYLQQSSPIIS